jgi:hypothetical protein
MFWLGAIAALAIILVYAFVVRPVLANQPAFSAAFKAEASFRDKLQAKVTGWRTKIAARLLAIAGVLVGCYDQLLPLVSGQDWTSLTAKGAGLGATRRHGCAGLVVLVAAQGHREPAESSCTKDDEGVPKVVDLIKPVS